METATPADFGAGRPSRPSKLPHSSAQCDADPPRTVGASASLRTSLTRGQVCSKVTAYQLGEVIVMVWRPQLCSVTGSVTFKPAEEAL